MCSSLALSTFKLIHKHHCHPSPELCTHWKTTPHSLPPLNSCQPSSYFLSLWTWLLIYSTSYKQNHISGFSVYSFVTGDHSTTSCVYCEYCIIFTATFLGAFHYWGTVFTNANSILTTALLWNYYLHFTWGNWVTERLNNMLNIPLPFYGGA